MLHLIQLIIVTKYSTESGFLHHQKFKLCDDKMADLQKIKP